MSTPSKVGTFLLAFAFIAYYSATRYYAFMHGRLTQKQAMIHWIVAGAAAAMFL